MDNTAKFWKLADIRPRLIDDGNRIAFDAQQINGPSIHPATIAARALIAFPPFGPITGDPLDALKIRQESIIAAFERRFLDGKPRSTGAIHLDEADAPDSDDFDDVDITWSTNQEGVVWYLYGGSGAVRVLLTLEALENRLGTDYPVTKNRALGFVRANWKKLNRIATRRIDPANPLATIIISQADMSMLV